MLHAVNNEATELRQCRNVQITTERDGMIGTALESSKNSRIAQEYTPHPGHRTTRYGGTRILDIDEKPIFCNTLSHPPRLGRKVRSVQMVKKFNLIVLRYSLIYSIEVNGNQH